MSSMVYINSPSSVISFRICFHACFFFLFFLGANYLADTIHAKIVGIRFYSGQATAGEYVAIRREASNPYDSNAIRVDNVMGAQIGHIPRFLASKLASYMVCGSFPRIWINGTKCLARTLSLFS